MPALQVVLGLLVAVAILSMLARRLRLPYPIVLVLGGLGLGFIPHIPRVELAPQVVFLIFLPPLLFEAAWSTSFRDFRANLRSISLLALGLVAFTTVGVAAVAHTIIPGLGWPTAFVLGAVVSPTDAVAATAIMQRLGAPRPVETIVDGESLLNDASGLVLYRYAVAVATAGGFVLWQAGLQFLLTAVGGVAMGLAVGWLLAQVQLRIDDSLIEITLSFLAAYGAYLAADELRLSGVLAVVAAGLYVGRRSPQLLSPNTRLQGIAVWNMAVFVLNGLAFILIGLQLPSTLQGLNGRPVLDLVAVCVAVALAVIVIRIIWTFPGAYLPFLFPRVRRRERLPPWQNVSVTAWSGMRGVVSLAAALAVPAIPGTALLSGRDLVILLTFSVILVTLVLQGLSLPLLMRVLGLTGDGSDRHEEKVARLRSIAAAEARLEEVAGEGWADQAQLAYLQGYYRKRRLGVETRFGILRHEHDPNGHSHPDGADHLADHQRREESMRRLRLEMIAAERGELVRLRDAGAIGDDVLHRVERDLDLEQLHLGEAPG